MNDINTNLDEFINKKEIEKIIDLSDLSHAYFLISREIYDLIAKHRHKKKELENGYDKLLNYIKRIQNIKRGPSDPKREESDRMSLYNNQNIMTNCLSLYVNELVHLRERNFRRITIGFSIFAFIISILALFLPFLYSCHSLSIERRLYDVPS